MSLKRRISVESTGVGEVGRLVDSGQADDRRMIRLVRDRRLLYARNNMPVASYYAQVKALWQEVADEMGWTVADVRRKWSHVRNSYSRHLRNEMHGARTGKGRVVSKWYLADELEFLREHMATDMRSTPFPSFAPTFLEMDMNEDSSSEHNMDVKPFITPSWFTMASSTPVTVPATHHDVKYEPQLSVEDSSSSHAFTAEENSSYFQFFRGIYSDYQELSAKKQRLFKRQCLGLLHELLDQEEGAGGTSNNENERHQHAAINLSHSHDIDDEPELEALNTDSILPHDDPHTTQFKFLKRE